MLRVFDEGWGVCTGGDKKLNIKPLVDVPPMYGPGTRVPTNLAISPFGSTD